MLYRVMLIGQAAIVKFDLAVHAIIIPKMNGITVAYSIT